MNYFKIITFTFSIVLIFSNCTDDENTPTEGTVNSICDCTQALVKINQEIKVLQLEGNIEAITALVEKAGQVFDDAIKCTKENTSEKVNKAKLKEALMSNCEVEERMIDDLISKI